MHTTRGHVLGSANNTIPKIATPTAPTPVHTAYAVPTGSVRSAPDRHQKLPPIAATVHTLGHSRVNPSVYFKPIAQPTSNSPAIKSKVHAMATDSIVKLETL